MGAVVRIEEQEGFRGGRDGLGRRRGLRQRGHGGGGGCCARRTLFACRHDGEGDTRRGLNGRGAVVIVVDADGGRRRQEDGEGIAEDVIVVQQQAIHVGGSIDANKRRTVTRGIQYEGVIYRDR